MPRIGRIDVTEADCMELVDRKTARLFSVCVRLGALAGHGDAQIEEKLGEYAWNLGMAFQLVDDVLDFTAREQTLGKPVGGDLREGKVTLPLVYALERATAPEQRLVETVLRQRSYEGRRLRESWRCPTSIAASSASKSAPTRSPIRRGRSSTSSRNRPASGPCWP